MVKNIKLALAICALSVIAVRVNAQANTPPQLSPQPDQTIPEFSTLVVTNTATDQDVHAQHLSYELLDRPSGATIDASGVITLAPGPGQGPSTNTVTTVVTDNGLPPLSATNSFTMFVTVPSTNGIFKTNVVLNVKIELTAYIQITTRLNTNANSP